MKKPLFSLSLSLFLIFLSFSQMFSNPASPSNPSNTKIAYVVYEKNSSHIFVMDHDGSNKKKLTSGAMPCWSLTADTSLLLPRRMAIGMFTT